MEEQATNPKLDWPILAGIACGSFAIALMSFQRGLIHSAPFLWFLPWILGLPVMVFSLVRMKTTEFGYHPLRYPMALWLVSLMMVGLTGRKVLTWEKVSFSMLFVIPFLLIAVYSMLEARKPGQGKQLEVPTSLEHFYRRLGWKWLTPPKWDFWLCWIGLLFSPLISTVLIVGHWNEANGHAWLLGLRVVWICLLVLFAYRWFLAPVKRDKYKETTVASMFLRVSAFLYYYSRDAYSGTLRDRFMGFLLACVFTTLFDHAFARCHERQTPSGVGEYEALEGPSLGL